ncbi:alpha beta-hydrolase [Coniophora puteana RWD-64-598 SS2]|uniref:Alpha beta-hydrolase n=1 Tax=Coniophora puteana (strain RWD-64-598) TaxID=741705 RepID=A0A5M3MK15_CONPW|nr:alpha beta-hydrolase [Coniophora puteana RWD-64-598 SS2]EIW79005.1 alpha beta-hydrolase [Coniophora puteana RWD-64-598 SS2]
MSLCSHCVQGVRHEGTPKGKFETVDNIKCYVATPSGDYAKDKVLLFLTDIFGIAGSNSQLLADDFARNGFKVVMPDYFNGDAVPVEEMEKGTFPIMEWLPKHGPPQSRPNLDKVIAGLKKQGVKTFASVGYCYGGRHAFNLAIEGITKVTVTNHPSLLKNPDDLEAYFAKSKAPLLINTCETDNMFPAEFQAKADEVFEGKFEPGYKREYFPGCTHGFSVRGDMTDPKVKAGKEGAYKAGVEWLKKYF